MSEAEPTLTDKFAIEQCKFGSGHKCCAFLMAGRQGFQCAKGTEVEEEIHNRLARGVMSAQGNLCSGPPYFKTEGYE